MEEKANRQKFNDTEEVMHYRSIDQEGSNNVWKKLAENIQEEVLGEVQCGGSKQERNIQRKR